MPNEARSYHHGSHRALLKASVTPAPQGPGVDAILVPTARPTSYLADAAALAGDLSCALVTLHSKDRGPSAADALRRLPNDIDLIPIDISRTDDLRLPRLETSRLITDKAFGRATDVSTKRNLALVLSHMLGWTKVLFLDDDITSLNPDDVYKASGLLDTYDAVGLRLDGFPDNSVVCHAYRLAGGQQQSFVGAGALIVRADVAYTASTFFPDIYNDDWFFLLDDDQGLLPTTAIGGVTQYPYDPFDSPGRAYDQEFGDVLAEGIYWLLDQHRSVHEADVKHWTEFLERRRLFIESVLQMVASSHLSVDDQAPRIASLTASLTRLKYIEPQFCESFIQAWARDRRTWRRHLDQIATGMPREVAIPELTHSRPRPEPVRHSPPSPVGPNET